VNPNDYLKMLRIRDWVRFYPFIPLIGAILARTSPIVLLSVGVISCCVIAYGFVINNYFDVEIDKKHEKKVKSNKNPLSTGNATRRGASILMGILLTISVILSGFLSLNGLLFTLLSIFLLTLYSIKDVRLKERFIFDIICHGLMFGFFPFLAGFTLAGGEPNTFILLSATLFTVICCEALLIHQINDYGEDLGNSDTTVTRIGIERGSVLLFSLFLLSVVNLEAIVHYFDIGTIPHGITLIYLVLYPNILFRGVINSVIGDHSDAE